MHRHEHLPPMVQGCSELFVLFANSAGFGLPLFKLVQMSVELFQTVQNNTVSALSPKHNRTIDNKR